MILAVLLMLTCTGIGSAAVPAICGDADGDGAVTVTDGVQILRLAADLEDACPTTGCDVDGNGTVSVTDAVLGLRRAAGLPISDGCGPGTISGRLLVPPATVPPVAAREREPNDDPRTAGVAGWIAAGETRRLTGTMTDDDPFDSWVFVGAGGLALDLMLTFPADPDTDLDLLIDDRRGGDMTCERTTRGRERCRVAVGSATPTAFDVVVVPASGSRPAPYVLDVTATATNAPPGISAATGAGPPLAIAPAVYRGEAAAIVAGELIVEMEPTGSHGAGDPLRGATRQALAAAGIAAELRTDVVAPDGTRLLTLPRLRASAATVSGDRDAGLAAKRARGTARRRTEAAVAALATDPSMRLVAPNRVVRPARVPRDPLYPQQWHLDAIGLPRAWDVTIGRTGTVVAVVDTGIRSDHPDLAGRLVPGFDFISNAVRANDGDGLDPDPFDPGDRPNGSDGGSFHGTHVAGTIAAASDGTLGVAGVTWRSAVMPLRVLGVGGGTIFDVAQAVRFAAGLSNTSGTVPPVPASVINLSLTTSGNDPVLRSAVDAATAAGALVIAAAGNTGHDGFLSPAGFPNVVSVAATDRLGATARYSSFGNAVDLAAPGGDIRRDRDGNGDPDGVLSTRLPGTFDYALLQGTSMASAHVSGVAALLLGVPGGASATRLRETLLGTADDRGAPGRDDHYGAGIVDAGRAVRTRAGLTPPADPVLTLASPAVQIASDESVLTVPFRNTGGATLVLDAPVVTTENGLPWLTAHLEGLAIRLEIDRDALAPGASQAARVDLGSNGGAAALAVSAEVAATPPEDLGPVDVVLRDLATQTRVAATTTTAAEGYRYRFEGVPPGQYEIRASTDRDGDGALCDLGESCGAYPNLDEIRTVVLLGGATIRARDFPLELVVTASEDGR